MSKSRKDTVEIIIDTAFPKGTGVYRPLLPQDAVITKFKVSIDNGDHWVYGTITQLQNRVLLTSKYYDVGMLDLQYLPTRDELLLTRISRPFTYKNTQVVIYYETDTEDPFDELVTYCKSSISRLKDRFLSVFR